MKFILAFSSIIVACLSTQLSLLSFARDNLGDTLKLLQHAYFRKLLKNSFSMRCIH